MRRIYNFLPVLVLIILISCVYASGIHNYISLDLFRENQAILEEYISENLYLSIVIFSIIYFVIVGLAIPLATILTLVGGFLFGQIISVTCIVVAASFGACVIFLSAQWISKRLAKNESGKWVKKMRAGFAENAFSYMLTLRLFPIVPSVFINLAAGILHVPLRTFFWGTFIGIIPSTFIYASVGVSLESLLKEENFTPSSLLDPQIIFSLSGLAVLALLPVIYKKFKYKLSPK